MMKMNKLKAIIFAAFAGVLALTATVLAVSTPVPAGGAKIESHLGVLNATKNEQKYDSQTNASFDDVVNIEVYVHNKEWTNSGKNANNVIMKVAIPSTKTKNHVITSTVGGSNTNIETLTARVDTTEASSLAYIPGTAIWTRNTGTNANPNWVTTKINDTVVGNGFNVGTVRPCCNFQESIIFQARIKVPTIAIEKEVKIDGVGTWQNTIQAQPGDKLNYLITVTNAGNTTLNNVVVRDSMPPGLKFISGSATLINGNYPNGLKISDAIVQMGVNIGAYAPGAKAYVRLQATVPEDDSACKLTHTNVAHATENTVGDYLNNASVTVICENRQDARIRIIKFNDQNGNRTQDSGELNLAGWQFRLTGNDRNVVYTTDSSGTILVTGLPAGRYTVTEITKEGWINTTGLSLVQSVELGQTAEFRFGNRQLTPPPVTPPTEITTLPASGPAEMAGMFVGSMAAAGGSLSYLRSKKNLKKALLKR